MNTGRCKHYIGIGMSVLVIWLMWRRSGVTSPGELLIQSFGENYNSTNKNKNFFIEWEKVMLDRISRVKEVCRKYGRPLKRAVRASMFLWHEKVHLTYCRNAKAGTTSWMRTFLEWSNFNTTNLRNNDIHVKGEEMFLKPQKMLEWEEVVFTVVRHPFTRLVSAYRDKISSGYKIDIQKLILSQYRNTTTNLQHWKRLDRLTGIDSRKQPTFREFAMYVADSILQCLPMTTNSMCLSKIDLHWLPFFDRCAFCDTPYNVIAKTETMEKDARYILLKSKKTSVDHAILNTSQNIDRTIMLSPNNETIQRNEKNFTYDKLKSLNALRNTVCENVTCSNDSESDFKNINSLKNKYLKSISTSELTRKFFKLLSGQEKQRLYEAYYLDFLLFNYDSENF